MKVLQLISSGGFYGAESVLVNLSVELERSGHHCVVGVFENTANRNTEVRDRAEQLGLKVISISCNGQMDWSAVDRIRSVVHQEDVEIIHSHGYKANFYALLARKKTGVPIAATCHNWLGRSFSTRMYGALDRYLLRFFDGIAAVSVTVADQLTEAGVRKEVRVISNGVSFARIESQAPVRGEFRRDGRIVVGSVGRVSPEKGISFLVEAAAKVCREYPNVLFVHVGDGPRRLEMEARVRQLGIELQFVFAGQRQDMVSVYRSFDIFVLPSLTEGMPMALLEAMSAALPIVATTVGSVPNIVCDSAMGTLVTPGNCEALEEAIREFLIDREKRESVGAEARKQVEERFSVSAMTKNYLELYRDILSRKGPCRDAANLSNSANDAMLRN